MSTTDAATATEALTERLFSSFLGGMDMVSIYLGDRLGFYAALADRRPRRHASSRRRRASTSATRASGSSSRLRAESSA